MPNDQTKSRRVWGGIITCVSVISYCSWVSGAPWQLVIVCLSLPGCFVAWQLFEQLSAKRETKSHESRSREGRESEGKANRR